MSGAIVGGWGWVIAAYGITWAAWAIYGLLLAWRVRREDRP